MGEAENREIQVLIDNEYDVYRTEVKNLVDMVEIYYGRTPDGVLNGVKCFTGHIAEAAITTYDIDLRKKNITAAHTHLRRVVLDCYKLMCVYQQNVIKDFEKTYRAYDISAVDDGKFKTNLYKLKKEANKAFEAAKQIERTGKNIIEDCETLGSVYTAYTNTYNKYCDAVDYIDAHRAGAIRLAGKHVLSKIIGFLGWLLGIGFGALFFLLQEGYIVF